jgi:hypothetical protein
VEIAKRIEAGQDEVLAAVANCGVTIREFLSLTEQVKNGELQIFKIIQATEPEEGKEAMQKKGNQKPSETSKGTQSRFNKTGKASRKNRRWKTIRKNARKNHRPVGKAAKSS